MAARGSPSRPRRGRVPKRAKHTHQNDDTQVPKPPKKRKDAKAGNPTRDNKEHAADVLASVGEVGAGEVGINNVGDDGDDEDENEYESDVSGYWGSQIDVEMQDEVDLEGGDGPDDEAKEEEESIVASMYEEEGKGDDALYVKLLAVVQELTKEHKLLHKKIEQLSARLKRKENKSDVEMEAPPTAKRPASRKKKPVKWQQKAVYERPAGRWKRDPTRLLILGYIRQAILSLLGRKNRKELLPDGRPDNIAAPSESMFYVKWTESEKSDFNRVAASIVTSKVMKDWPDLCPEEDRDAINDMAVQHIRYLIKLFKRQRLPQNDSKELSRRLHCSADTRMRTLFKQRLKTVSTIKGLEAHRQLIVELGIQGTSSDEEDSKNPGQYLTKQRKELSNQVCELKSKIDLVYKQHYKLIGSKGSQVRKRIPSGKVSTRRFQIKNLPRSIMSLKWLSTLTETQIALFEFNDYNYDFSFPDELLGSD
ncbi:hypothetical protein FRC08_008421 [Ceratobasidium sp. 394]|nr:hypothetical protein FRC08_008421 [Ceratobasidium sp. 394]